jgi:hypothetical protein
MVVLCFSLLLFLVKFAKYKSMGKRRTAPQLYKRMLITRKNKIRNQTRIKMKAIAVTTPFDNI